LEEWRNKKALPRLALAGGGLLVFFILMSFLLGGRAALLLFPLALGASIPLLRLDHAIWAIERFNVWADRTRVSVASKTGWPHKYLSRPLFGGIGVICHATDEIPNPYLRTGVRSAGYLYYSGGIITVVITAGFIVISFLVGLLFIALILWIISKLMEK